MLCITVCQKIIIGFEKTTMARKLRLVALMLDLRWLYKRHAAIFVGTQQYATRSNPLRNIDWCFSFCRLS